MLQLRWAIAMNRENPKNSGADDRVAALEHRVSKLEREVAALRAQIGPRRESLFDKLRPKMVRFDHYPPRELKVPPEYLETSAALPLPTIAIVSPSFNQAQFIGATIASAVDQKYPALRFHVQDGGSSDDTLEVLKRYDGRITWESGPDKGQANAVNLGFRVIEGDIMAYLNSDDVLLPGSLDYVARVFAANPDADVLYGHRICLDEEGKEIGRWILPQHDSEIIKWFDFIPQETMFWRRRAWDKVGEFDESFDYALDWDFILRMQARGLRFKRVPRFLSGFRVHDAQKTTRNMKVGLEESSRLRLTHLGFDPTPMQIHSAIAGYMRRHVLYHRLYKLKVLRY